jgi:hypothetical protein
MTIWPPKVKKIRQNAPGSEKMWFNILKNESRRAAYRFFINSMIHQGELIPPKSEPRTKTTHGNVTFFYFESSNGHFQFRASYINDKLDTFTLFEAPPDVKPHIDYVDGMFEQEYPEQYAALQDFFKENAPATEKREEEKSPSSKKKVIRKIMLDWSYYMDTINSFVIGNIENVGIGIPVARYQRLLGADIDTDITYKEVRDYIDRGPGLGTEDFPLATIRAIQATYARTLQRKNPEIVWENFINFVAHFREKYMTQLFKIANNQDYSEDLYEKMENAVYDITPGQMRGLAGNIWRDYPNDVETLMLQLPNYD